MKYIKEIVTLFHTRTRCPVCGSKMHHDVTNVQCVNALCPMFMRSQAAAAFVSEIRGLNGRVKRLPKAGQQYKLFDAGMELRP